MNNRDYMSPEDTGMDYQEQQNSDSQQYSSSQQYDSSQQYSSSQQYDSSQQYSGSQQYDSSQQYNKAWNSTQQAYGTVEPQDTVTSVMAILSLIFGIVSIVTCCIGIGLVFGIIAIVLSGISLSKKKKGKGLSIGGLVTGIIGTLLSLVIVIYMIFAFTAVRGVQNDPDLQNQLDELNELFENMDEA